MVQGDPSFDAHSGAGSALDDVSPQTLRQPLWRICDLPWRCATALGAAQLHDVFCLPMWAGLRYEVAAAHAMAGSATFPSKMRTV